MSYDYISLRNIYHTGGQWHTIVILATQDAEIRRIAVQNQPGQTVCETLSGKKILHQKKGLMEWLKV
jgi:hypothetical protein